MASHIASGVAFGAALTAAGMYNPSAIVSQLKLEDWHMMEVFLTAVASSSLVVLALDKVRGATTAPRGYSSIGIFSPFDGNLIGGALLGAGMALSGSCPGTVLTQIGTGVRSGYFALAGGILGGIAWTAIFKPLLQPSSCPNDQAKAASLPRTIQEAISIPKEVAVAAMEVILVTAIGSMATLTIPGQAAILSPVLGGLLVGLSQLFSMITRGNLVGVSTAYEEIGGTLIWATSGFDEAKKPRSFHATLFGMGLVGGARAVAATLPSLVDSQILPISTAYALTGGFLMVFGARMAGGCSSGHGISGISLMSISSVVTIVSTLAVGSLVATLLA